jgi:putative transcriptional regulator
MEVSNRLKEIRTQHNLTQQDLAGMVGVTRQTIIAIEKGKFVPSVKLALELSRVLKIPIHELFWLETIDGEKA